VILLAPVLAGAMGCTGANPAFHGEEVTAEAGVPRDTRVDALETGRADVASELPAPMPDAAVMEVALEVNPRPDQMVVETAPDLFPDLPGAAGFDRPILFSTQTVSTTSFGGTGGDAFSERCPTGQAVIGYQGFVTTYLDSTDQYVIGLQAICAGLSLPARSLNVVQVASSMPLPLRGRSEGGSTPITPWQALCAREQVAVGVVYRTHNSSYIDNFELRCAPQRAAEGVGALLVAGPAVTLPPTGGPNADVGVTTDCPAGQVVVGHQGAAGSRLDRLQLTCAMAIVSP
jgi:hypothetical protein